MLPDDKSTLVFDIYFRKKMSNLISFCKEIQFFFALDVLVKKKQSIYCTILKFSLHCAARNITSSRVLASN